MRSGRSLLGGSTLVAAIVLSSFVGGEPAHSRVGLATESALSQAVEVFCKATVNEPHFSRGAGGAIYKTSVSCTGTGVPQVDVRVRGYLSYAVTPSSPRQPRAESDQVQAVTVNGAPVIFYTPQVGANGGRGAGAWFATSTAQAVAPVVSNIDSDTYAVQKTI